jgi:hypothetical protein
MKRILVISLAVIFALIFVPQEQNVCLASSDEVVHEEISFVLQEGQMKQVNLTEGVNMIVFEIKEGDLHSLLAKSNDESWFQVEEDDGQSPEGRVYSQAIFRNNFDNLMLRSNENVRFAVHSYAVPQHYFLKKQKKTVPLEKELIYVNR